MDGQPAQATPPTLSPSGYGRGRSRSGAQRRGDQEEGGPAGSGKIEAVHEVTRPSLTQGHCIGCREFRMAWVPDPQQLWGRCENSASPHFNREVWAGCSCEHRIQWRPKHGFRLGPPAGDED